MVRDCSKDADYGVYGGVATLCSEHTTRNLIPHPLLGCRHVDCRQPATHAYTYPPIHCASHALPGETDVISLVAINRVSVKQLLTSISLMTSPMTVSFEHPPPDFIIPIKGVNGILKFYVMIDICETPTHISPTHSPHPSIIQRMVNIGDVMGYSQIWIRYYPGSADVLPADGLISSHPLLTQTLATYTVPHVSPIGYTTYLDVYESTDHTPVVHTLVISRLRLRDFLRAHNEHKQ